MKEKPIIDRRWKGGCLKNHSKIRCVYTAIKHDISAGIVFPALRENEIHLYHAGGRAFRIRPQSVYTHSKYTGGDKNAEVSLGKLALEDYERIKGRCKKRNSEKLKSTGDYQEGWIVSRLFEKFSYWSKHAEHDQPKLIDVEVRFRRSEGNPDKIDLLFLENDHRLRFVEVKRQYDPRVRSREGKPEVLNQICRYEDALKTGRNCIVSVYRNVPEYLHDALELERFSEPTTVCSRVPVLVCRNDARHGQDTWLQEQLRSCSNNEIGRHLIVDGGGIQAGSFGETAHPSWCPDGLWEQLNLKEMFEKIDESSTLSAVRRSLRSV